MFRETGFRLKETLINCLSGRIAALRGARNLNIFLYMSRFLRSVRLALHPAQAINQCFLKEALINQHFLIILCLLMLTAGQAFGQSRTPSGGAKKPAPAPFMAEAEFYEESPRVTKVVFKNGLTALVYVSNVQPLVSVQAYVHGGFLDDPDEATGISELTARARENIGQGSPTGTIRGRARALGGVFYGHAGPWHSRFELTVPSARWRQALNIQADAMLTPFENNEAMRFNVARIAENIRDESVPPEVHARKELRSLAFGEPRFLQSGRLDITPEKIIEFHKNRYVLPAITLVVAGDVRSGDVLNEVVRVFSAKNESTRAALPPTGASPESAGRFRYRVMSGDIAFPKIFFGFPVPSENSEEYRALEVTAAILGIGENSIFNTRLRDRKSLIFTAKAEMESFAGTGFLSIELETESQNIDRTEIAFWTEVEILKREGLSETELARALAQLERLWWERRETVGDLADALALFEFQGGWRRMDGYVAEIRKVTTADVRRVITRYLTISNCVLLEYLPRSITDRNPTEAAVRATIENLLRPAVDEELRARIGDMEPNFKIPSTGTAVRLNEVRHSFQTASILRGPEIYIREDRTSPLLEMGFYFSGGKAQEDGRNAGVTSLMLELMLRNERENRQLEIYGGRLTPVVTDDFFGFYLSIPARNISGGLERIKQAIKSPVFNEAELEKLKQIANARARSLTIRNREQRSLKEALFRGHSYAAESSTTLTSLKNITVKTVSDWYEENVRNVNPFVTIIGNTEGTSIASWFVSEFSGSRMREGKRVVSSPAPVEKTELIGHNDTVRSSTILMGFRAPSMGDTNVYETLILKEYLENHLQETGAMTGKNQEREAPDQRITCEYRPLLASGSFVISATVKAGEEAMNVASLGKKIANFSAHSLPYADFQAARTLAAGMYMAGNQTRKAQIENLTKNLLAGRSLAQYQNFSRNIEQVEEEEFKELTRRVLDINKAVIAGIHGGDR